MIGTELAEFLESPCSLIVGTVDAAGMPDASRAWGVEVLDDRTLRVLLSTQAPATRRNVGAGALGSGGAMALTATHFVTFDSVQLKGRVTDLEDATPADRIRFEHYCAGAIRVIAETDGTPEDVVARFMTGGVYSCRFTVEAVFDQTPGHAAGTQLAPEPA